MSSSSVMEKSEAGSGPDADKRPRQGRRDVEKPKSASDSESVQTVSSSDDEVVVIPPRRTISRTVSEAYDGIETRHDVECVEQDKEDSEGPTDPNLVTWAKNDPGNPKAWAFRKKWGAVLIVSCFTFISPVSSTMIAPALTDIGRDLGITSQIQQSLTLSIFLLAYAVGPLFLGPLSEIYGRVPVLQLMNLVYLFFNLGCGLARTRGQMIAFRFLAGLGGSVALAIGGGVLGDLFVAEQRGRAMSLYSLMPLMGPAVGPIAGAFVTERTTWRWVFYATTIADAVIQVAGLFWLQETFAPVLLQRRKARLIKETGNQELYTQFDDDRGLAKKLGVALTRPFKMLGSQVIVQVMSGYMMLLYGQLYLQLSTFPTLWTTKYHESVEIGGLNYISLGIGFFLGAQICAPLQDRIYAYLKRREGVTVGRPEFRIPMMVPGAVIVPVGLLIYGWSAQYTVHWIVPNIGVAIFGAGTIIGFQCIQGYLVDSFTLYAASAVGAATVLRSLAGFGFPLFAPYMFDKLGYGWGNTLLAGISIIIGWPAPILLWFYGRKLRERSTFAAGGAGA